MSVFDEIPDAQIIEKTAAFLVVPDGFPASKGHTLIVSRRNDAVTFFDLNEAEQQELLALVHRVKRRLDEEYSPDGYNVGMNCGAAAGQTVMRFHCHVIPRYQGDVADPTGGVRHCIPHRGNYLADRDR